MLRYDCWHGLAGEAQSYGCALGSQATSVLASREESAIAGVQPNIQQCYQLSPAQFHALLDCNDVHQVIQLCAVEVSAEEDGIPESVSLLLQQFAHLFEPPTGLPPH